MTDLRDVHATIFVAQAIAGPIEAARRDWDPLMAARIAAHVTLVYPEEAPNCDLLLDRIRGACSITPPFRLRLRELTLFEGRDRGVYVSVDDIDGGFHTMREQVLRPPFSRLAFRPHVTVMHPRTSRRGLEFLERSDYRTQHREFTVQEIAITAFDGTKWVVVRAFPLMCM